MSTRYVPIELAGFEESDLQAIEDVANELGVSFDEAVQFLLLGRIAQMQAEGPARPFNALFSDCKRI